MNKIRKFLSVIIICIMTVSLCACNSNDNQDVPQNTTYTIQYSDDSGIHTITVEFGKLYSINSTPNKTGYDFLGYYDSKTGGTQYIDKNGISVLPFADNKDIILYPQFKAKEYTLVLDYQGAEITGIRSMKVTYDSEISELPLNLTLEDKSFSGWYTEPNREGNQIADRYGVLPKNSKVTENNFDLYDTDGYITLYAGFKMKEFTVTFNFSDSVAPEEVQVEYGTLISDVQPETRVDGKTVLLWSKKRNDTDKEEIFNGKVTSAMSLYAAEYAPIIDFDSNGGNAINSIIARAGDAISLPTPTREYYQFVGWQTSGGTIFSATTMPESSIKLTAKWQAIIIFDTNGGTEVSNISKPQGAEITLPVTEMEGYIFAGWYTVEKDKYVVTTMPSTSVALKAGWYEISSKTFYLIKNRVLIAPSIAEIEDDYTDSLGWVHSYYRKINLSEILNGRTLSLKIKFTAIVSSRFTGANADTSIAVFSAQSTGSTYLLSTKSTHIVSQDKKELNWDVNVQTNRDLYVCYYNSGSQTFINSLHCDVIYPNYNDLYL